jgi:histone deacetylase 11
MLIFNKAMRPTKILTRMSHMLDDTLTATKIPIIYRPENNITFLGLQKLHPFDPEKYGNIANFLIKERVVKHSNTFIKQKAISEEQLLTIHTKEYLKTLEDSSVLASITEFPL